jgi:hypothetical protein
VKRLLAACVLALLAPASPAAGATLLTGFLVLPWTSGTFVVCSATNASAKKTLSVLVELLDDDGGVSKSATLALPPLGTRVLSDDTIGPFTTIAGACRFSLPGGRNKVRAYAAIQDVTLGTLFISEAR